MSSLDRRQSGKLKGSGLSRRIAPAISHAILIVACLAIILPFIYLFYISISYFRVVTGPGFGFDPTLTHYIELFSKGARFPSLLVNSVIISGAATLVSLVIGSLSAYGLSRFRWSRWLPAILLGWLVVVQTIPAIALVGPYYSLALQTGLHNTRTIVVLVYVLVNLPLVIWMMIAYFQGVPRDLEEAGIMDGMTPLQVFLLIMVPLSAPALAASGVIAFIFSWKEFLMALTLTSTPDAMTLPVGIAGYVQDYNIEYGLMTAASSIAVIPGLLVAAFAQRYIVSGLTAGAVKS